MSTYSDELTQAMHVLGTDKRTVFLGQSVRYSGHAMFNTLKDVPMEKRIELPVFEDSQLGMSIGLALAGMIPISIYPRMDFLIIAANQLVNHLDIYNEMSNGQFNPKVIIRTAIGSRIPFAPGLQHGKDLTFALHALLRNIRIVKLEDPAQIMPAYRKALDSSTSTILVEEGDLY
jgi:pyruvate/2-oxoglutarate/acetoin dehydrogenase E1 component